MRKLLTCLLLITNCFASERIHVPWSLEGADARIREYRMGAETFQIELPNGEPLPKGVVCSVTQVKHAFNFGGSLAADWKVPEREWYPSFKEKFARLFNYATIDFYWAVHEKKRGQWKYNKDSREKLDWANSLGMRLRGHPLMWHEVLPSWMTDSERSVEAMDADIARHVKRLLEDFPEIHEWDVYNEAPGIKWRPKDEGIRRWHEATGGAAKVSERMLKTARAIRPDADYILNHYTDLDVEFKEQIQHCLDNAADFEAIGIQTHMHTAMDTLNEERLWDALENYSLFGKPIHLSEISILSCETFADYDSFNTWKNSIDSAVKNGKTPPLLKSTKKYEAYQAALAHDFYTLAFSHPGVDAIIWWTITDLEPWRGMPAGLLDANGNSKPVYDVLDQLINDQWKTRFISSSVADGRLEVEGFYGQYELELEYKGTQFLGYFDLDKSNASTLKIKLIEKPLNEILSSTF